MTEGKLVSVVIPAYNGERLIGRTLASVLAQTYRPIEIVVVNDGSTDRTAAIIEAAAAGDSRIRCFHTKNSGIAATRNFGISQARGELIAPLDADDLWHPTKIARQVELMERSSPDVGLVYCWSIEIDEDDRVIPSRKSIRTRRKSTAQGRVTTELTRACFIESGSAPLMKRALVEAVGGYDADLWPQGADDWKLYLALSEICAFAVIPEYLVGYRQTRGSASRNLTAMTQSQEHVLRWIFERRPDLPEDIKRQAVYSVNHVMAHRAIDHSQFAAALHYFGNACKAYPKNMLDRTALRFAVRFLGAGTGLGRSKLRERGWTTHITFDELSGLLPVERKS